jgi:GDP-L-fucose synthase
MDKVFTLQPNTKVYVAGHYGLVGSAIWRSLEQRGFQNLLGYRSKELDLRDPVAVRQMFAAQRPEVVFLAAAKVGGILANNTYPADFISDNLRIQVNVIDAAREFGVTRLVFLGSSCIYPKFATQPIAESSLLTGTLEPTNDAYAIAKIAGILQVQANRRQYGVSFVSAMPTNLYGPNDNFDPQHSHVLPALIRRFHEAKLNKSPSVTIWGTGTPRREFLHVDDLASAALMLLEQYDHADPINVGVGEDISIKELAQLVADVVGYEGTLEFDTTKPDGTPRKLLDVSRLFALEWRPQIQLRDGISSVYNWYTQKAV